MRSSGGHSNETTKSKGRKKERMKDAGGKRKKKRRAAYGRVKKKKGAGSADETSRCRRMACYEIESCFSRLCYTKGESYQWSYQRSSSHTAWQGVAHRLDHYRHCPLMDIYECANQRRTTTGLQCNQNRLYRFLSRARGHRGSSLRSSLQNSHVNVPLRLMISLASAGLFEQRVLFRERPLLTCARSTHKHTSIVISSREAFVTRNYTSRNFPPRNIITILISILSNILNQRYTMRVFTMCARLRFVHAFIS